MVGWPDVVGLRDGDNSYPTDSVPRVSGCLATLLTMMTISVDTGKTVSLDRLLSDLYQV